MANSYSISIIGSGNMAWSLAKNFEDAGHHVREIYSRRLENAEKLCGELYDAVPTDEQDFEGSESGIFFLAIKDDVIQEANHEFSFPEGSIVAHCSGFLSMDSISGLSSKTGVFYPLQSFSKGQKANFRDIPILIEGNDYEINDVLEDLAGSLSNKVIKSNEATRNSVHLSAVFASNFSNHLLTISKEILGSNDVQLDILQPLVKWTIQKAFELGPDKSQTGPAFRGDFETIDSHLRLLSGRPELVELYENFTRQIMDQHDKQRDS